MSKVAAQKDLSRKAVKLRTGLGISLTRGRCRQLPEVASCMTKTGRSSMCVKKEKQDDRILPIEIKYEAPGTKDTRI